MKNTTRAFIAGCIFLLSSTALNANVSGNIQKAKKESLRREIISQISCPEFVTENSETNTVKAVVSVNEDGKVIVYDINSANAQLKTYVEGMLKDMKIKNRVSVEKFVLVVKFAVI